MLKKRLVACLLVRDGLIVQSIGFERYLPVGNPKFSIEFIARWDVDEIVLLDTSASLHGRKIGIDLLGELSKLCFVPLTVGGGIKTVGDVREIISSGADKVVLNTHAVERPQLITEIADSFGSQCVVVAVDCRLGADGKYRVHTHSGTKSNGLLVEDWVRAVQSLGAGEILLNSIDRDGSKQGYDIELIKKVSNLVTIPVIACGGVGCYQHLSQGIIEGGIAAVAAGNIFHHTEHSTIVAKAHLLKSGIDVRLDTDATYIDREFGDDGRVMMLSDSLLAEVQIAPGFKDLI